MKTIKIVTFFCALIFTLLLSCVPGNKTALTPTQLTCEYLVNPSVIDVQHPRLSWINTVRSGVRGQYQTAYQIQVASSPQLLDDDQPDIWDSEKIESDQSFLVDYDGPELQSIQKYWWRVRVWNREDIVSAWSETASWNMGLLDEAEWEAKWIGAPWQGDEPLPDPVPPALTFNRDVEPKEVVPPPAPMLRKEFALDKEVDVAKAYVTGLGFFEFYINGEKVGEDVLVPNQTCYGKRPELINDRVPVEDNFREYRVMYLCYDITNMLQQGANAMGAILGNGFYNAIGWPPGAYGSPRFLSQVYVKYTDGTEDILVSDDTWKIARSPIVMDMIYEGEHYDARLEQPGWNTAGFDDSEWEQVAIRKAPEGKMKAHMSPTDLVMERLEPIAINKVEEGHYVVDFGQEIAGWLHISDVNGEAGQKIDIQYISNDSVRMTTGDNTYTLSGNSPESYAARFTWFVFRYAELTNWPGELDAGQLKAEAVYTNVETTGEFETSNSLFNNINKIWWRSQTDNMHGGIASDCPNRERLPYTGDGQASIVTVMHNFDAKAFYNKWTQDVLGSQNLETGYVPNGAPYQPGCGGGPPWGAAMNIYPWEFYLHYGDLDMLEYAYEGMKEYVRYMLTWTDENGIMFSQRLGNDGQPFRWFNLGEWAPPFELVPDDLVHTFYLWRCIDLTSKAARALSNQAEAQEYDALAQWVKEGFHSKFYDEENGTYGPYGGNIFALFMGVPEDQEQRVIAALKADIAARDGHIDTGIFGTKFFYEVLADYGMQDLAYEAMNKKTQPSYGWWVENGNTTTWEHYESPGSGNHPMFGGGMVWFYRKLAGMNADPENPGYKHIIFRPQPVADLTYAAYSNLTPYGTGGIRWENQEDQFLMNVTVPVGSKATVYVPAMNMSEVKESGKSIEEDTENITFLGMEGDYAVFAVNSGTYSFTSNTL